MRLQGCLAGLLTLLLFTGCEPAETKSSAVTPSDSQPVIQKDPAANPPAGMKRCFKCSGAGKGLCTARGCVAGNVDCPNPCLKLSRGIWGPLPGYPPDQLFQKFPKRGGYQAFSSAHVGEVVTTQNGQVINSGRCTMCAGTTKLKCGQCLGSAHATCSICKGQSIIPQEWTALRNPTIAASDSLKEIKLKDGRVIIGKILLRTGSTILIRTEEGQVKIDANELVE